MPPRRVPRLPLSTRRVRVPITSLPDALFVLAVAVVVGLVVRYHSSAPPPPASAPIAAPAPSVDTAEPSGEGWIRVERVIDGDTIKLATGERVRLIGVDTPESVRPNAPVERFGREAAAFTKSMCEGRLVRLEYDWQRTDDYGRTLAYVLLSDGRMVNAELIKAGYGRAYTRHPFTYMELFRTYEREARASRRGRWAGSSAR